MSTTLNEGFQRFDYGDDWRVFRYDCAESGYLDISNSIPHTKSVDFLGVFAGSQYYFIEVKDFRGYRIPNKKRLKSGELAEEVARKVKDTLAGIVAGCRSGNTLGPFSDLGKSLVAAESDVRIVLWLEDDAAANISQWKQELSLQTQLIKEKLRWLKVKVIVVSQSTYNHCPPQLTVTNLPGACGIS
jgi:hypothetical protein